MVSVQYCANYFADQGYSVVAVCREQILAAGTRRGQLNPSWFAAIHAIPEGANEAINHLRKNYHPNEISFVLLGNEDSVELAEQLAAHFCPEYANSLQSATLRRYKDAMNDYLAANNVLVPRQCVITSNNMEDIARLTNSLNYPLFAKPNQGGRCSFAVKKIKNQSELARHLKKHLGASSPTTPGKIESFLVQEYLEGTEWAIDTVSVGGQHAVSGIIQYNKINVNSEPVYRYMQTIDMNNPVAMQVSEYALKILDTCAINFGLHHIEIMLTEKGPQLIEVNSRMSGANGAMQQQSQWSFGMTQLQLLINLLNDSNYKAINTYFKPSRSLFLFSKTTDPITHIDLSGLKSTDSRIFLLRNTPLHKSIGGMFDLGAVVYLADQKQDTIDNDSQELFAKETKGVLFNKQEVAA